MKYRIHKGDNLEIMKGMTEQVDMIYMDPPFNTGKDWTGKNGATFKDTWNGVQDEEGIEEMLVEYPRIERLFETTDNQADNCIS